MTQKHERYLNWLKDKNLSPNSIRLYMDILGRFPVKITTNNLREYFLARVKNYEPISLKTTKYALNSYIKFKKLNIDWERISRIIPSSQRKLFPIIDEKELAQLKAAKIEKSQKIHERNNLMLDFLFYSGVRISELVNIKHQDWRGKQLRIHGKGNKVRYILLPPFLIGYFRPYADDYLFTSRPGQPVKTEYIRWLLKVRTEEANIRKRITPHTFRRSFATLLYNRQAKITTIQRLLGHASIHTTETYIHNDFDYFYQDFSRLWRQPETA
jgi:integrase/recombinase XerD